MCLLAYFSPDADVDWDGLRTACENNPDGFGWAIHRGDHIELGKSMDHMSALESFYDARDKAPDQPAMFHARFATHGSENLLNVHPFYVGDTKDTVLAHNGVLPVTIPKGDPRSDTRYFAEDLLPLRSRNLWDKRNKLRKLEAWMGGSKFVVFTTRQDLEQPVYIVNEGLGHWDSRGVWWSNDSYQESHYRYFSAWRSMVHDDDDRAMAIYEAHKKDPAVPDEQMCPCCDTWLTKRERFMYRFCETCHICLDCESWGADCLCYYPEGNPGKRMRDLCGVGRFASKLTDEPEWDLAFTTESGDGPSEAELQAIARDAVIEAARGRVVEFSGVS